MPKTWRKGNGFPSHVSLVRRYVDPLAYNDLIQVVKSELCELVKRRLTRPDGPRPEAKVVELKP